MDRGRGRGGSEQRGRGGGDRGGAGRGRGASGSDRGAYRGGPPGAGRGGPPGADRGAFRGSGDRGRGGFAPRGNFGGGREPGGVYNPGPVPPFATRLTDNSQDVLVSSLRSLRLQDTDMPVRPGFGTIGKAIKLRANFFPITVPKRPLFEYDVAITPAAGTASRRVKRRIFQLAEQTPAWTAQGLTGFVAHDHAAKMIAARTLPQPLTIAVPWFEEEEDGPKPGGKEYTLTISFIQDLDPSSLLQYLKGQPDHRGYDALPIISALNLVLAAHPSRSTGPGVMVGRNRFFFPSPGQGTQLGAGLEAFRGFYSSVRPSANQLLVNVNVATTAFYQPSNLADAMLAFRAATFGGRVHAFVKGVRIKTRHLGYRKAIKTVSSKTAKTQNFVCEEYGPKPITVQTYFKKKYQIDLKYPDMPLVDVGGQRSNFIPAELCDILPNQPFRGKLSDDQTANMITAACKPPNVNAKFIAGSGLDALGYRPNAAPLLNNFGVSIGQEMVLVPGRILPSPGIKYGQGTPRVDERAGWNLRDVKFNQGGRLENWGVLVIKDNSRDEFQGAADQELRSIVQGFSRMCATSGMQVDKNPPAFKEVALPAKDQSDPIRGQAIAAIQKTLAAWKPHPSLILIMLANGDNHIYNGIKHLCDLFLGVHTVCVQSQKIRKEKGQPQYFANVALKVNMKMGGTNHILDPNGMAWLKQQPTMLVGADVTHPGPGSTRGTPSIAAVVASIDDKFGQFPASMEIQESRKEMITNMENMMVERLTLFKAKNKILPARILFYRDGVSEGQFATVVNEEYPAIKKAFKKFSTGKTPYLPKLTMVICGKRHHTRFYPTEASEADRDGNPRPGTVVDRGVTAVYDFDFFLQAHGGLQGTTRPTHYYVVHDEIGFGADQLQTLTNAVSYLFARATKAVSLVSPAYYADLAAERGRCYLHKLLSGLGGSSASSSMSNDEDVMKEAKQLWHNGVAGKLKDTMYYL